MLLAQPAAADTWYEHYFRAERALESEQWVRAVEELNGALGNKGDSGARVRSYGMNVVAYFPYLKLGIAYYHLGQLDAALQAFETEARLGAIAGSGDASAELDRYRLLVEEAAQQAAAAEQERVRRIVSDNLGRVEELERAGLLDEAMAALDQALAVAPDDADARAAMSALRPRYAEWQRAKALDTQVVQLLEDSRALMEARQFGEATSRLRQALFLKPDPSIRALLDEAERRLRGELEADPARDARATAGPILDDVRLLESAGNFAEALARLQAVLVVAPSNAEALEIQDRLLRLRQQADAERARLDNVRRLLAEAGTEFEAGRAESSLSAANQVLALDPGNETALALIARAYGVISRNLLGTGPKENIPPAIRFADLRLEADDGSLVQTITSPEFRLSGVIIDDSPVDLVVTGAQGDVIETELTNQPLGEFTLTEFRVASTLQPGLTTFRLVATDSADLSSASAYAVVYARPLLRTPLFYASLLVLGLALAGVYAWQRRQRLQRLRTRRFNPYVAGAPILEEDMFFGRQELVDRILQTIHNNSLLIYGERRIGKTSIQHQLHKRLREIDDPVYEFHPVYVDLQGTPEERFFQTIAADIFEELAPVLDGLAPSRDLAGDYSYRDFVRDIHAVLKTLRGRTPKKVKLVLLIDEVDEVNAYDPRINQKLRSLFMKSFAENLAAVVSGVEIKKRWEQKGSPWYNFFEEIEVAPLKPGDARELISRPIRGMFRLDRGAAERIIAITGGKPYLIQKVCMSLVTRLHEQRRRRITIADVDAVGAVDA